MANTIYFLLALMAAVSASGKMVAMKSISFTTEDGLDVLNPRGRELTAGRTLSLKLEIENDGDDETPAINCPDLTPIDDSDCPFDKNVKFRVHTRDGVETSHGYSCHTFANKNNTCIVTLHGDGAVQGIWLDRKNAVDFHIRTRCKGKKCAAIELNPTIGGCDAEKLEVVDSNSRRRLGSKAKEVTAKDSNRKLSWQDSYWLSKWNNCYAGDDTMTNVFIGLAVGSTLTNTLGSVSNVQSWLEAVVAEANTIYRSQLNIKLHVTNVEILSAAGSESFDNPGCTKGISAAFEDFRYWNRPAGTSVALWHYFDDCYKSGDSAIGLGYIGALCNTQTNVGITHYNDGGRTWLTFAHEVGHNFGAPHTFEEGQGTTGGIMDYGTKLLNNEYQFNEKYRKGDICGHLSGRFSGSSCAGKFDLNPTGSCGNGILESNEECECPSGTDCSCCKNCQLKSGAQCSPHFAGDCCTDSCKYADTTTECTHSDGGANGKGYCRNGQCTGADCALYGLGNFCGLHSDNPCKKKCMYAGSCQSMNGWTSGGEPINYLRDGAYCTTSSVSYGECKSGVCEKVANPNPTPASTNSPTPAPVPTNPPTKFPTPNPTAGACLTEGIRCFDSPDSCCSGFICPMDDYNNGLLPKRKVKCQVDNSVSGGQSATSKPSGSPTAATTTAVTVAPTVFPTPVPVTQSGNCVQEGLRCFDDPNSCCPGLRCTIDDYNAGLIPQRKVKCQPS